MQLKTITYISNKLLHSSDRRYSAVIVNIAVAAVAISICVMMISVSVLKGFQDEITNKIIGFSGHIHVSNFTSNTSFQSDALVIDANVKKQIQQLIPGSKVTSYAVKGGIIKTKTEIEGAVLKGVDANFDWSFFNDNLLEGRIPNLQNDSVHESLISKSISSKLNLKVGDNMLMYFIQQPARIRKFKITGIYNTGLEEFDNKFIICGINNIQKLNNWRNQQADAYEIILPSNNNLKQASELLYNNLPSNLNVESVEELFPQLFDWLNLQNLNVLIIIVMMLLVGTINMITALLIIILEKTKTVGLLKALGATNADIRKIFIINSSKLIFKGAIIGNSVGITFILVQHYLHLIPLDASSYYMHYVPTKIDLTSMLVVNIFSITISILCMAIPAIIIRNISPVKAIRF